MTGQTIVVTGATNGVGLGTSRALAAAGAHVILAVRNAELGAQRAADIGGTTSVVQVDLADLESVRGFPARLAEVCDGVDVLINNAGMVAQHRSETVDGFETMIGTNFLGPFALTNLIIDRVRSKIVIVGSEAHKSGTLRFDDMHLRHHKFKPMAAYGRSKLATMLWGLELDRRLRAAKSPITSQLTHPGWVASNLSNVSDTPVMAFLHRNVQRIGNAIANDIDAGAAPTLYCLSEPIPPGSYVGVDGIMALRGGPVLMGRSTVACDYELAGRLWEYAERETGTALPALG